MNARIITLSLLVSLTLTSCDTLQQLSSGLEPTTAEIAQGLKQALEIGISEGASLLSQRDGYFKSEYKILLPPEARKVTDKLKFIPGFTDIENVILEKLNRAAEDAATSAKPINKFNAIEYWADAVNAYNKIPLVEKVNPNLDQYVTEKALDGLFAMVAKKELQIRTDITSRTTELLRKVFAKQD
jgi:uncharacterized protein DUF4197